MKINNLPIVVLDGKNVLLNPEKVLSELCDKIEIPFDKSMLSWKAGARSEDGVWAKHWYHNVHKSTGFGKYKPKDVVFPERLKPLLSECQPLYEKLSALAIQSERIVESNSTSHQVSMDFPSNWIRRYV